MAKEKLLEAYQLGFGKLIESDAGIIKSVNNDLNESGSLNLYDQKVAPLDSIPDPFYVNCILQRCEVENRNGRVYPRSVLDKEMKKYNEAVQERSSYGERNHADEKEVDLKNMPYVLVDWWWDGNALCGKLEILTTRGYHLYGICSSPGDEIAELLRKKIKIGISSRGLGSVAKKDGKNVVQNDFTLICFDLVTSPSTPGAYLYEIKGSMNENINKENNKSKILIDEKSNIYNKLLKFN